MICFLQSAEQCQFVKEVGMDKIKYSATVLKNEELQPEIFSLLLEVGEIAEYAVPGQFIDLYSKEKSRMLPRPISICDVDKAAKTMKIVFRIAGEGTREFSKLAEGEKVDVVGPLGKGYDLPSAEDENDHILLGGGIGIPPMLYLAKTMSEVGIPKSNIKTVLGFRDDNTFLVPEFEKYSEVYITSDNGAAGVKGNVIDGIKEYGITGNNIYACGPTPMLRGIKSYAMENGIKAQISLEERMACGIGACLACVVKTEEVDDHSKVKNKRICKDGPVFYAEEVNL